MEIDITRFVRDANAFDFSASIAERGANAGPDTWRNAVAEAGARPLLDTPEALQAMRDWAEATGAWDDAHIAAWSDTELNALFIQLVSGDMRETGLDDVLPEDFDWEEYEAAAAGGHISGTLFRGADGSVYFSLEA